jgi:hypothetical protein
LVRSGTLVSPGTVAVAGGARVADPVTVVESEVGGAVAGGGVWLPTTGEADGVGVLVAGLVAVATPDVGPSVGVGDGTELVAVGVSDGTAGGSVGAVVGGGDTGLVEVGTLVAPVGVAVGMV